MGILTGGGDCPGLNAVVRGVVKTALLDYGWEMVGILDGFEGLVHNRTIPLNHFKVKGILPRGGTILGTTNRGNPFAFPVVLPDGTQEKRDYASFVIQNIQRLELDGLFVVGGDGTLKIAHRFAEMGVKVIGIPKTIDNDIAATDYTFGFMTAVGIATEAIDRLHTTAESHHRVMLLEVMGRDCGWIALYSGLAGGADVILIPEIPYNLACVMKKIRRRQEAGSPFSIIVVAEGAYPKGGEKIYAEPGRLGGISVHLAEQIRKSCDLETRTTILGHLQRGGSPHAFDRLLATRFAVTAVHCAAKGQWDHMVSLKSGKIVPVPLAEAIAHLKRVDPQGQMVKTALSLGISLGDDALA